MRNRSPLILAVFIMLVPELYVGIYLALVKPSSYAAESEFDTYYFHGYRHFGRGDWPWTTRIAPTLFWPLEQMDRNLRPGAWASDEEP